MSLASTLRAQDGVVNRRQALAHGLADHDVRRLVRRREWAVVHPGVYVHHTGPPTWRQRAWAAVLVLEPAALWGAAALRASSGPDPHDDGRPVEVAVARTRRVRAPAGVSCRRVVALDERLHPTASRLLAALDAGPRGRHTAFLRDVLGDVAAGTCSALEHGYLTRVERPHGLPTARRQVRDDAAGVVHRDVQAAPGLVVELDGRLVHGEATRWDRDLARDLASAAAGTTTVRLG